jgi:hypothetical protein
MDTSADGTREEPTSEPSQPRHEPASPVSQAQPPIPDNHQFEPSTNVTRHQPVFQPTFPPQGKVSKSQAARERTAQARAARMKAVEERRSQTATSKRTQSGESSSRKSVRISRMIEEANQQRTDSASEAEIDIQDLERQLARDNPTQKEASTSSLSSLPGEISDQEFQPSSLPDRPSSLPEVKNRKRKQLHSGGLPWNATGNRKTPRKLAQPKRQ